VTTKPTSIPTVYKGVQFRSRLEARWAAFFDIVGIDWNYEPLDFAGYIPDFFINNGTRLFEVKPVLSEEDVEDEWKQKIEALPLRFRKNAVIGGANWTVLKVLTATSEDGDEPCNEWCNGNFRHYWSGYLPAIRDYANHDVDIWDESTCDWSESDDRLFSGDFTEEWNRAGNAVQWKAPRK
jgi:hypothetical protein